MTSEITLWLSDFLLTADSADLSDFANFLDSANFADLMILQILLILLTLSIIFDILKAPAFRKYSTSWVFQSLSLSFIPQLLPEAISLDGLSKVQNQEFRFWGGSCVGFFGFFGPKGVFWCQDNVQKVSKGSHAWLRFSTHGSFTIFTQYSIYISVSYPATLVTRGQY